MGVARHTRISPSKGTTHFMEQKKLDRINALARKSKVEPLTDEEKAEQAALREEYILEFRAAFRAQLDSTVVRYPDGTEERLADKGKNKK